MFDTICMRCSREAEALAPQYDNLGPCDAEYTDDNGVYTCGGERQSVMRPSKRAAIGDEMDYVDDNLGPSPIRIRSRSERRRLMAERGLVEFVRHVPVPGSDKSPNTTTWAGMDPQTLANATALVSRVNGDHPPDPDFIVTEDGRGLNLTLGKTYGGLLPSTTKE